MSTDKNTYEAPVRKKSIRILALIGILLLVALYGSTLVFSLLDSPYALHLLMISICFTILVPVMIYTYQFIYRLLHKGENK